MLMYLVQDSGVDVSIQEVYPRLAWSTASETLAKLLTIRKTGHEPSVKVHILNNGAQCVGEASLAQEPTILRRLHEVLEVISSEPKSLEQLKYSSIAAYIAGGQLANYPVVCS